MDLAKKKKWIVLLVLAVVIVASATYLVTQNTDANVKETKKESATLSDGDTITENNLKIVLGAVTTHDYEGSDSKDEQLIVIPVKITNLGESETTVGAIDFKLQLSNKEELYTDSDKEAFVADIKPNKTVKKNLFYRLNESDEIKKLIYNSDIDQSTSFSIE